MAIMTKVKKLAHELPHGTAPRGFKGALVDKGERYGAAAAFAYSKTRYGSKFIWGGHGADLWLGIGGLAAAALSVAFGGRGISRLAPHLERLGDAGMISAISSLAAQQGMQHAGLQANLLPATPGKRAIKGDDDILGMVPGGKAGAFLTDDQMLNFSSPR
jgi:hypothetical protein